MNIILLILSTISLTFALQCVPPYQSCPNQGCSIFPDKCFLCSNDQIVCPDGETCVDDYDNCPLLPFQNSSYPLDVRIENLLELLQKEEKIGQLYTPTMAVERLGIPMYEWSHEALHGVAREKGPATAFPQVIGLGSTFDTDLIQRIASAISDEARAKYTRDVSSGGNTMGITFYAPNINIYRDPRWGRGQETPGEDPFLTSMYAKYFVWGLQNGQDTPIVQSVACCKHYAVYNFDNWTAAHIDRHNFNALPSESDLLLTYLPAFKACIREGNAQTVMCSYNAVNNTPACASYPLLKNILRKEWGFDGFVVSDEGAINDIIDGHHYATNNAQAAIVAVSNGCDQELPSSSTPIYSTLLDSLNNGKISEEVINTAVENILRVRFRLGLFDNPFKIKANYIPYSVVASPQHKAIALEAARKSIVLLKNNNILPLNINKLNTIAVIGPNAAVTDILLGNYAGNPTQIISILDGIKNKMLGKSVTYAPGCSEQWCTDTSLFAEAFVAAKNSDAVILVMGIRSCPYDNQCWIGRAEIEGEQKDRTSLDLPGYQQDLIELIASASVGKPLVVVLVNGGSITMPWIDIVDALLTAFYPGEQGGTAVADVLFGDYNPGGRLTTTWVRSITDLPLYIDMSMTDRTYRFFNGEPLFSFGYGLSYTTFAYNNIFLNTDVIEPCKTIVVTASISNSGNVTGDEVVQVYFTYPKEYFAPNVQLVNFARINLGPMESIQIGFNVGYEQMAVMNNKNELVIAPGTINVFVGGGQPLKNQKPAASFLISGPQTPVSRCPPTTHNRISHLKLL